MGSKLLNGSPQLSVILSMFPSSIMLLAIPVKFGTWSGTAVANELNIHSYILSYRALYATIIQLYMLVTVTVASYITATDKVYNLEDV